MNSLKYILLFLTSVTMAQAKYTLKGHFNAATNKAITLKGFSALEELPLDKSTTDANGNFTLTYPADYVGAAVVEINKGKKVIVLLNHENFEIQWDDLSTTKSLKFINSTENATFDSGLSLYQNTQEKKNGISYLVPLYATEPQKSFFKNELDQLNLVMPDYLKKISDQTYASYYLKVKMLIADLQLSLKRYPERTAALQKEWNALDFSDVRLMHSGLYDELLQTNVTVIMNREKKYEQLNHSTDLILKSLQSKPEVKQSVAEYLFNLFEKKSLFDASEHLALGMLNDGTCQLDDKHKALFEQYRKMANGNLAPNIECSNGQKSKLYDLKNQYKLVVFGASWCPKCVDEMPKLKTFYDSWKKDHGLEIVFISLDTQKIDYENFVKDFPWISSCDFKGWESKPVVDYCIFGSPTMYLLDANNVIKLKPISAAQINAWFEIHP
ncbi:thioredoxin family protein [Flavobacterium sp.]|uniref:TlpA family protein disulfide reductase n=1 Tax=Flavobacterium sp. TaxID=239 RepID=UPI00260C83ED|nr:thioredoxin family protein [Flavobacterium sp.]